MSLLGIVIGVVTAGGFVGFIEQMIARELLDALAPTLIAQIDAAIETPGAENATGLIPLLFAAKTAIALRAFIWWVLGMVQVAGIGFAVYARMRG